MITRTEVELGSAHKPALTPKPMSFFFHKSWLLREMIVTTLTASLTTQGRGFSSFLVIRPSTSRPQTTSRLTSHHSLLHSHAFPTILWPNELLRFSVAWCFAHSSLSAWDALPWLSTWITPTGPADAAQPPSSLLQSWVSASPYVLPVTSLIVPY